MSHHQSCTENDLELVWHCCQCGENANADAVLKERDEALARERAAVARTWREAARLIFRCRICNHCAPTLEYEAKRAEEGKL